MDETDVREIARQEAEKAFERRATFWNQIQEKHDRMRKAAPWWRRWIWPVGDKEYP